MTAVSTSVAGSWINGVRVVAGGPAHRVINPATGEAVADYALATPADVDAAVAAARASLSQWATSTPAERSAVLFKLAQLADRNADTLVAEEVSQTGKPVRLAAEFDVPGSIDNIDFFAGAARH
ncbi:MAG TPA: aldehyde dehydrogenase family protein, partial [Mycobacterium sp.]|nr:aldehyde dehydrogenase family protein [Mycobacterium sp.]